PTPPNDPETPPPGPPQPPLKPPGGGSGKFIAGDSGGRIKYTTNNGAHWASISMSGFSGGFYKVWLEPFKPHLVTGLGALNIYIINLAGVWYGANILAGPTWTLKYDFSTLSGSGAVQVVDLKPDTRISGGVVVLILKPTGGGAGVGYLIRLTANGATET